MGSQFVCGGITSTVMQDVQVLVRGGLGLNTRPHRTQKRHKRACLFQSLFQSLLDRSGQDRSLSVTAGAGATQVLQPDVDRDEVELARVKAAADPPQEVLVFPMGRIGQRIEKFLVARSAAGGQAFCPSRHMANVSLRAFAISSSTTTSWSHESPKSYS